MLVNFLNDSRHNPLHRVWYNAATVSKSAVPTRCNGGFLGEAEAQASLDRPGPRPACSLIKQRFYYAPKPPYASACFFFASRCSRMRMIAGR